MKSCLNLNYYYLYFWFWNVVLWCVFSFILEELPFFSIFFHFFSKISLPKFLPLQQLSSVYVFFPILEFTKQPNQHIVRRRRHLNANVVTSHAFLIYFFPIFFFCKEFRILFGGWHHAFPICCSLTESHSECWKFPKSAILIFYIEIG